MMSGTAVRKSQSQAIGSVRKTIFLYVYICAASIAIAIVGVLIVDAKRHPIGWVAASQFLAGQSVFMADRELGFVPRPFLDSPAEISVMSYFTNSRSARVDASNMKTPTQVDFISVGDSQTLGYHVSNEETFTSQLSKITGLTGLNFGVSGYGGVGALLMMRRELDLRPRFIVYGFWADHFNRNVAPCLESGTPFCIPRPIVTFGPLGPHIEMLEDPLDALARARRWYGHSGPPFLKDMMAAASRNWDMLRARLDPVSMATLQTETTKIQVANYVLGEMKVAADAAHAQLIVVYLPIYFYPEMKGPPPELVSFAREAGITLVDMTSRFRALQKSGVVIPIPGDGHMSAATHQVVAEEIAKHIQGVSAIPNAGSKLR